LKKFPDMKCVCLDRFRRISPQFGLILNLLSPVHRRQMSCREYNLMGNLTGRFPELNVTKGRLIGVMCNLSQEQKK